MSLDDDRLGELHATVSVLLFAVANLYMDDLAAAKRLPVRMKNLLGHEDGPKGVPSHEDSIRSFAAQVVARVHSKAGVSQRREDCLQRGFETVMIPVVGGGDARRITRG
jgi:hypothetical protein